MEDKLKNLLQRTDRMARSPVIDSHHLISTVRRRVHYRRIRNVTTPIITAALFLMAVSFWYLTARTNETAHDKNTIATLESQVRQLQARTDTMLNFIHKVLEEDKKQRRLNELYAQLARISDPLEEIQKQTDKTAFNLVYQADRMYQELNLKKDAVEQYKRIIELFPKNQWAEVAKQRLSEIENKRIMKGNLL